MTPIEFEQDLDRWGGDLSRWPDDRAARARAFLAVNPAARRQLEAAAAVEDGLLALRPHQAPAHLAGRIMANLPEADGLERWLAWLTGRLWRPALLALAITVGGYLAGATLGEPVDSVLAEDVMTLAFQDMYAELDDAQ